MKQLGFIVLVFVFSTVSMSQEVFRQNGRAATFNEKAQHTYSSGWNYSRSQYYTINNDTLYFATYEDDDYSGTSIRLNYLHINEFKLESVASKRVNKYIDLKPKDDDYRKNMKLEFNSEELFDQFYATLKQAFSKEDQATIANFEKGIVDPKLLAEKQAQLDKQAAAEKQRLNEAAKLKSTYETFYYDFDLATHGADNQFVVLLNDKGEECMKVDRLNNTFFRNVNGTWVSKAEVIKNFFSIDNYEGIKKTYGKQDTLAVWNLENDEYSIVEYTQEGGNNKYRYFPTTEVIQSFDEMIGKSMSYHYNYNPKTRQIIYFDTKTVHFTISGGYPSMNELLIMLFIYKSNLFK